MKHKYKLILSGFSAGVCNGLFGSGGGMIVVPCLEKYASLPAKKAHATAVAVIAPLALVSIFRYLGFAGTDIGVITKVCIAGTIGSFLGARFMKRLKSHVLKKVFGCFIILAAVRMVIG